MDLILQYRVAEIVAIVILGFGVIYGSSNGLIKTVYHMIKTVLAVILSLIFAPLIVVFIPQTVIFRYGIAYLGAFFLAMLLLGIVGCLLNVFDHIPVVKTVNKLAGAIAGVLFGLILLWVAMVVIGTFHNVEWCSHVAVLVQGSPFLSWIQGLNPIPDILGKLDFPII